MDLLHTLVAPLPRRCEAPAWEGLPPLPLVLLLVKRLAKRLTAAAAGDLGDLGEGEGDGEDMDTEDAAEDASGDPLAPPALRGPEVSLEGETVPLLLPLPKAPIMLDMEVESLCVEDLGAEEFCGR